MKIDEMDSGEIEDKVYKILKGYDKKELIHYIIDLTSFEGLKEMVENYNE